ncbi:hypothetical protein STA3757_29850 [Stanieria sp. NIES-3757]|nr:hypothetical protein STA3757_29850 [Stanieria sp. NIES-3757]
MKRLLVGILSAITLSSIITPVLAGEVAAVKNTSMRNVVEVTPFNLVTHGYQGYFANQGIPSNAVFLSGIKTGKINAQTLVKAGIARGRLAPEKIDDQTYLNHVEWELSNFDNN